MNDVTVGQFQKSKLIGPDNPAPVHLYTEEERKEALAVHADVLNRALESGSAEVLFVVSHLGNVILANTDAVNEADMTSSILADNINALIGGNSNIEQLFALYLCLQNRLGFQARKQH